jgi:hypothetical protein
MQSIRHRPTSTRHFPRLVLQSSRMRPTLCGIHPRGARRSTDEDRRRHQTKLSMTERRQRDAASPPIPTSPHTRTPSSSFGRSEIARSRRARSPCDIAQRSGTDRRSRIVMSMDRTHRRQLCHAPVGEMARWESERFSLVPLKAAGGTSDSAADHQRHARA